MAKTGVLWRSKRRGPVSKKEVLIAYLIEFQIWVFFSDLDDHRILDAKKEMRKELDKKSVKELEKQVRLRLAIVRRVRENLKSPELRSLYVKGRDLLKLPVFEDLPKKHFHYS